MNNITPISSLCTTSRDASCQVALGDNSDVLWPQFVQDVTRLSAVLSAHPATRWALAFTDSYLFATAFFACSHANKTLVLPGNLQSGALAELSGHYDALLHDNRVEAPAGKPSLTLPCDTGELDNAPALTAFGKLDLILYTSGSSGTPKAVPKALFQLQQEIHQLEQQWGELLDGAAVQSTVSHQHIYGLLFRVLWPLAAGRPFQRHDLVYPEQVGAMADYRQVLVSSPALLKRIIEPSKGQFRAVFSSGGPLPLNAAQSSQRCLGALPVEVYGSTETGGIGFRQQVSESTPWQLFSGIEARLDELGCLQLLSPYIDPEQWYPTADMCALIDNHRFILKGRADRIVKIEEKRVSLPEIEQRLCQNGWVTDAATIVQTQGERQIIAAVVVLSVEGQKTLAETGAGKFKLALRQRLRSWLEPIAIPRQWRFVGEIPQNAQGKRQHQAIKALFNEAQSPQQTG